MRRLVRPGRVMTFQEARLTSVRPVPPVPLLAQCVESVSRAFTSSGRDPDIGRWPFFIFGDVGLPAVG